MRSSQDPKLPTDLLSQLRGSSGPNLRSLVEKYGRFFAMPELRQILLNPFVDGEIFEELASIRQLTQARAVQAAIAQHHRAPEAVAMRFVPHLFWRELLEISVNIRIRASVRRAAERYLLQRLPRLTAGEKIALARRAVPSTLGPLLQKEGSAPDLRILGAALDNPRMTEQALIPLLRDEGALPRTLQKIADHPRWQNRYEIRVALCRNPQTPFRTIQDFLSSLSRDDLKGVGMVSGHSSVVLRWVSEHLDGSTSRRIQEVEREVESWDVEGAASQPVSTLGPPAEDTTDSDTIEC